MSKEVPHLVIDIYKSEQILKKLLYLEYATHFKPPSKSQF